jgi:competence protein ComEC
VTIGSKSLIPKRLWEELKTSGTAHVVVASGMNVTLVAKFLISSLVIFLSRRKALFLAVGGVWMYALVAGFEAPIIRAAVMGTIAFSAQELGRMASAWRALMFTVLAMLFIKPEWITDIGFILSASATASLIVFEKKVRNFVRVLPQIVREDFSTSFAAQIGVAPVLFITFGQVNLLSPFINAAVLWTIVPITILGIIGGVTGLIFVPLGRLILFLTYPLTSWFIFIIGLFS